MSARRWLRGLRRRPRRWGHWTLRSRLVLAIGALTALALLVSNLAGLTLLRAYLTDRVDDQLRGTSQMFDRPLPPPPFAVPRPPPTPPGMPDQIIYYFGADGELDLPPIRFADEVAPPALEPFARLRDRARSPHPYTVDAADSGSSWRVLAVPRRDDPAGVAVFAISLRQVDATADRLLLINAAVTGAVLVLLSLVAAAVVRIGMLPLTRMEAIAAEIAGGNLSRRVDDADPHTETGRLGIALNTMLARIEAEVAARTESERRLRQFVADASHELRTPLTSIRGFAELYRRGGAPPGPLLDETMSRIEAEAARMGVLVEDLLLLARLDLRRPLQRRPVDLLEIAADTIRDAHARVPGRTVRLAGLDEADERFEPVTVLGDEHRLRQVATNLVANSLQHTPACARITVRVGRLEAGATGSAAAPTAAVGDPPPADRGTAVLEVADDGPGVAPDHAPRIFERLYRVDPSRARGGGGGSGLGLSIVAAIVHSHGGRVELESAPGRGATFRVLLPT